MVQNSSAIFDPFEREPPIECYKLRIVGIFCILLFILSVSLNSILLWIFIRYKELRGSINTYVIALAAFNLIESLTEIPFITISNFKCKWIFKREGCIATAFIMYFVGCTSMYLMAAISFERFYVIYRPMKIKNITLKTTLTVVFACVINGLIWAVLPLFGWSHYSLEGAGTSCSVEWQERSFNVISYNVTIFVLVFLVPVVLIIATSIKLAWIVANNLPNKIKSLKDYKSKKRLNNERNLTTKMIIFILIFVFCWTPYAVVALYSAFINENGVEPLWGTLPALFAKSSTIWSSMFYLFLNKKIRRRLFYSKIEIDNQETFGSSNSQKPTI